MATTWDFPILNYQPEIAGTPVGTDVPVQGSLFYWPSVEHLTGGQTNDLDAQNISSLPADSLIIVVIDDLFGVASDIQGESHWLRVQDASSPVTDIDAGVIVPINYDSILRPWVLHQELVGGGGAVVIPPPPVGSFRITILGDTRVTTTGDFRII